MQGLLGRMDAALARTFDAKVIVQNIKHSKHRKQDVHDSDECKNFYHGWPQLSDLSASA